VRNIWPTRRRM